MPTLSPACLRVRQHTSRCPGRGRSMTRGSPWGFGSSCGNCAFFYEFGLEISEEGVRQDVGETLHELGVHSGWWSPLVT